MNSVRRWIEKSPYTAALGVELKAIDETSARLHLPYNDANSNPGGALHGGVAASLAAVGSQAMTRAVLGDPSGPWHICSLQLNYLAAVMSEDVIADARLLRRGKSLCFVEVSVETEDGKPIAHATTAVRGRFGAEPAAAFASRGDDGGADPGPMGPHIGRIPFIKNRGAKIEHMAGARSRIVMPYLDANADENGGVHDGAVLALLDTTGAMACWAETGPGRFTASTPSLQAQFLAPPRKGDLVAYGTLVHRDSEIFWSDVEVASSADGAVCARGTVIYRIIT